MQSKKIAVNKNEKQPEGVTIEVIEPENQLETDTLTWLLASYLREQKTAKRLKFELPDSFQLRYQAEGSFLLSTAPGRDTTSPYYAPPRPLAVLALQRVGRRFDVAYAVIDQQAFATAKTEEGDAKPAQA